MIKTLKISIKQDKEKYRVPRKVQDVIPISCIWPDGIFKVGNRLRYVHCSLLDDAFF